MLSENQGWTIMNFKTENIRYNNILVGNIYSNDLVVNTVYIWIVYTFRSANIEYRIIIKNEHIVT